MRASKYDLDGRINLVFVEFRRINHPALHLLPVNGLHMYALFADGGEGAQNMLVDIGDLPKGRLPAAHYADQFLGELQAVVGCEHLHGTVFPVEDGKGREEIGPPVARGEAFDAAV